MSGRAGRDGSPSVCHLLVNARQVKNSKDQSVKDFCGFEDKENCRRRFLLRHLGDESGCVSNLSRCCDHCNPLGVPDPDLKKVLEKGKRKRRKQHVCKIVRTVDKQDVENVKSELLAERKKIVESSVGQRMLGEDGICHERIIDAICEHVKYISSVDDLKHIRGLRPHLFQPFFDTIIRTLHTSHNI